MNAENSAGHLAEGLDEIGAGTGPLPEIAAAAESLAPVAAGGEDKFGLQYLDWPSW